MLTIVGSLYYNGDLVFTQEFQINGTTSEIATLAMKAFGAVDPAGNPILIDEVVFRKVDGSYLGSFYNNPEQGFVQKWAGQPWVIQADRTAVDTAEAAEAATLGRYDARCGAEALYAAWRPEVEAWARLRAALRGLGGDL